MPTSKMFFFFTQVASFLDDLQYIEIIRYDFFFRSIIFGLTFFFVFHANYFLGLRIFKVILTIFLSFINFEAN